MIMIDNMKQQVQSKRQLVSFPPINVLIQRYNSLPSKSIPSIESQRANPSLLKSQKSSISSSSSQIKKLYISKSSSYFKKSIFTRQKYFQNHKKEAQLVTSTKEILRLVDSQNVLAIYKTMSQPKTNVRLTQKTQNLMRISNYQDFSPFKRSHQIGKKVPKVQQDASPFKKANQKNSIK